LSSVPQPEHIGVEPLNRHRVEFVACVADILFRLNEAWECNIDDDTYFQVVIGTASHNLAPLFELTLTLIVELVTDVTSESYSFSVIPSITTDQLKFVLYTLRRQPQETHIGSKAGTV
jgi:hypothetical protein